MLARCISSCLILCFAWPLMAGEAEIAKAIAALRDVGKEGAKNEDAAAAWKSLTAEGAPALVPTLNAFQGANVFTANWLRSAVDAIVEGEAKAGRKPDVKLLEAYFLDGKQNPQARRIAYELFEKQNPEKAKELITAMIDDPSLDLRRDAIARRMELAKDDAKALEPLFTAARDRDQVESLAKKLNKTPDDVVKHFNFITSWQIVGPFDGPNASGFATAYPPEQKVDLNAKFPGKGDAEIGWKPVTAKNWEEKGEKDYMLVDLATEIGKIKDCVAFAYAVVEVEKEMTVELRAASQNGIKMYVNGKSVFEREAYHQGTMMDQHAGTCTLKAGKNEILLKICQNDQKEVWAQRWVFQARLCDSTGGAVPFKSIDPKAAK